MEPPKEPGKSSEVQESRWGVERLERWLRGCGQPRTAGGGRGREGEAAAELVSQAGGHGPDTYFYIFHVSYFTPKCDKQKGSGRQQALFSLVLFFPGSLAVKGAEKSSCGGWREVGDQGGCHFRVRIWRSGLEADVEEREAGMEGHWGPGARAPRGPGRGHRAVSWNREQKAASAGTSQWTHSRGRDRDRFTPDPPCCRNERTDDRQCSQGGTCTCSSFSCSGTSPSPPGAARGN